MRIVKLIVGLPLVIALGAGAIFYKLEFAAPSVAEINKIENQAKLGDVKAERKLADLYFDVRGLDKNLAEAAKLYEDAAQKGDALSQFKLASMYDLGDFFQTDKQKAYMWASLSMKNGLGMAKVFADALRGELSAQQIVEADKSVANWKAK